MTIVKLPLPEEKLDRLIEVAKREGRQEDVKTLTHEAALPADDGGGALLPGRRRLS